MAPTRSESTAAASVWRRALRYVSLPRLAVAALLLAGLFALLYFVLLPDGGGEGVAAARMADTPSGPPDAEPGIRPGSLARDFEASNLDGERFRLSDFRGRPVVINFWATWCTSCLAEMPVLEQARRRHADDGLVIVGVNSGESASRARGFIDALDLHELAVALDPDLTISDAYGVRGLPQSVFIDADGVIRATYQGQVPDELLREYVLAAIDGAPSREPPVNLRFVNVVPREHVLEVYDEGEGRVRFVSRRFRCDDAYCGTPIADRVRALPGTRSVDLRPSAPQPELIVAFDPATLSREDLVREVADALRDLEDPLYTQDLQIRYSDEEE